MIIGNFSYSLKLFASRGMKHPVGGSEPLFAVSPFARWLNAAEWLSTIYRAGKRLRRRLKEIAVTFALLLGAGNDPIVR